MTEPPRLMIAEPIGGVRLLTMNRPAKRNAIDRTLFAELLQAFAALDGNEGIRAVVLTGADPAFCGGVDLADAADPELVAERRRLGVSPPRALLAVATPVIGAINGACVTGGLELALACDFLIASDRARFADTHVQLGMIPAWGGSALLADAIGRRQATELSLTGRFISAYEAREIGLVNRVVPHDKLLDTALEAAGAIAAAPPGKVAGMLEIIDEGDGLRRVERLALERRVLLSCAVDVTLAAEQKTRISEKSHSAGAPQKLN